MSVFILNKYIAIVTILTSLVTTIFVTFSINSYVFSGIDLTINTVCMQLSFKKVNQQYQLFCKCCIKCERLCNSRSNSEEDDPISHDIEIQQPNIVSIAEQKHSSQITSIKSPNNHLTTPRVHQNEVQRLTVSSVNQSAITAIQNEGIQQTPKSDFILNRFALDRNNKGELSQYSFTSLIQDRTDKLIAHEIADNEIVKNYVTKGDPINPTNE